MAIVYILTAIISIAVAFLLVYLARLSSQAIVKEEARRGGDNYQDKYSGDKDSLKQQRQLISNKLAEVFDKELKKRGISLI